MNLGLKLPAAFAGTWWWPDTPGEKFLGNLSYNKEHGGRIKLLANRPGQVPFVRRGNQTVLHGCGTEAEAITIFYPWIVGQGWSSNGIQEVEIGFFLGVFGSWFENDDSAFVRKLWCTFEYVESWAKDTGFELKQSKNLRNYSIKYKTVSSRKIVLEAGVTLRMGRAHSMPSGFFHGSVHLEEKVQFGIESRSPRPLAFFLRKLTTLRDFLSLGISHLAAPVALSLECDFSKATTVVLRKQTKYAKLVARTIFEDRDARPPSHIDCLFTESDLGEHFISAIQAWFREEDRLEHALVLYNCANYSERFQESELLFFSQCVETLHRRTRGGTYVTPAAYTQILPKLTAAIPPELDLAFKDSLRNRLKYGNEFALRKRIALLFKEHEEIAKHYGINGGAVASEIADARNYLTHFEPSGQTSGASRPDLWRLCVVLRLIIEATFLVEMGLPQSLINQLLKKSQFYLFRLKHSTLAHRSTDVLPKQKSKNTG